jgi:hypothetical protein
MCWRSSCCGAFDGLEAVVGLLALKDVTTLCGRLLMRCRGPCFGAFDGSEAVVGWLALKACKKERRRLRYGYKRLSLGVLCHLEALVRGDDAKWVLFKGLMR